MRILGIDPGSLNTGYGIIDNNNLNIELVDSGCIKNKTKDNLNQRFNNIYSSLKAIIKKTNPEVAAFENIIYCNNTSIAIKLGEARGVAILAAVQSGIPIAEYAPKKIKQAVLGRGSASKHQVQDMIKRLLKLENLPQSDTADALAVAICHANNIRIEELKNNGI